MPLKADPTRCAAAIIQVAAQLARNGQGGLALALRDAVDDWKAWDARRLAREEANGGDSDG